LFSQFLNRPKKIFGGKKMELSEAKIAQLRKQPIVESSIRKSDDKKWILHKTTITDIKPVSYFEKVLEEEKA